MLLAKCLFIKVPCQHVKEALRMLSCSEAVEKNQDANEVRDLSSLIAHADCVTGRLFGP